MIDKLNYRTYERIPEIVKASEVQRSIIVECYNCTRLAPQGDFIVRDKDDRVMVMKRNKFLSMYREVNNERAHTGAAKS